VVSGAVKLGLSMRRAMLCVETGGQASYLYVRRYKMKGRIRKVQLASSRFGQHLPLPPPISLTNKKIQSIQTKQTEHR